jgi:hypothetical protein
MGEPLSFPRFWAGRKAGGLTEVNRVNTKKPKTLLTGFLTMRRRAVDAISGITFDKPKLSRKENLISLSYPFEPFPQELFAITIETLLV